MRHLIISREYPPAAYAPGGIGTYAANIARLMAERGEIVHVIAQRWPGAPKAREAFSDGRLIVHRIGDNDLPGNAHPASRARLQRELDGLKATDFPNQWFAWHAAFLAEHLIGQEGIDVIEGQEWEAPLYYLLLRRALGMAPRHSPPCIVHLHSATAFTRHYNGALVTPKSYMLMKRMEDFCIRSADALLCPSRYYAAHCIDHFGLPQDSINVIPLPVRLHPPLGTGSERLGPGIDLLRRPDRAPKGHHRMDDGRGSCGQRAQGCPLRLHRRRHLGPAVDPGGAPGAGAQAPLPVPWLEAAPKVSCPTSRPPGRQSCRRDGKTCPMSASRR